MFQSNIDLMQDIYFYMIKKDNHCDFKGIFLVEFLLLGDEWIQKYSELFWENASNHIEVNSYRNSVLWKSERYKDYFDYIFYHFPEDEMYN